jgi:hypothetical protein
MDTPPLLPRAHRAPGAALPVPAPAGHRPRPATAGVRAREWRKSMQVMGKNNGTAVHRRGWSP